MHDLRKVFLGLPASTIYEALGKTGEMDPAIRPLVPDLKLVGPAFTVKCLIGDMTGVIRAVEEAQPGDVLVIDGGGSPRGTIIGGSSTKAGVKRGLAGAVTNSAARDLDSIRASKFPDFAPAISVRGVQIKHPGWLQVPVSVGEIVVHPGDWIIGDNDGVVVVPGAQAQDICERALKRFELEQEWDRRIDAGETMSSAMGLKL
jgi:4-hydroxy-4-methyl-2-oxoglutarate aldolase